MAMTDPIADMLTRIRNANSAYHEKVEIPASKIKAAMLDILKEEGFVKNYESVNEGKTLKVTLKYGSNKEKVITGIKRISKPGLGLKEQLIFPEIEYDKVDKARGMDITIVTTAATDEEGRDMLKLMGMPFEK